MITPIMFTEKQCGRVITDLFRPELADFAHYEVLLTVIYTDGRDSNWSKFSSSVEDKGLMTGAFLIPKSRIAAGGALIDLKACAASASRGKASIQVGIGGRQSTIHTPTGGLAEVRYSVMATLAHEIFHMIQAWRGGNIYDGEELITRASLRYSETFKRLMDQIARKHPDRSSAFVRAAAYVRHPSEQEAEQFARGLLERFRKSIESGGWDECMPVNVLKRYVY